MDICIQIITNAATHALPAAKAATRYVNGDIHSLMLASDIGTRSGNIYTPDDEIGMKRMGFVFVIDAPAIDIAVANDVVANDAFNSNPQYTPEGWDEELQEVIPPREITEGVVARNWYLDLSGMTQAQQDQLAANKYTTIDFLSFNALCHDKLDATKTLADMGVI